MGTVKRYALIFVLVLFGGMALGAMTLAVVEDDSLAPGGAPEVVAYQGEVRVDGVPYSDNGFFKFAIITGAGDTTYWSNDGTSSGGSPPTAAVPLAVSQGLFSVLLGDTLQAGMNQALTADVFSQPDRYLRVWFSTGAGGTFEPLVPDTRIASVPYALQAQEALDADTVDGLHVSELVDDYQNVVVVAKGGGDFGSVQAAIDSISIADADNPYLVWVAPGVYSETVTMKPFVHLQGAGQEATVINSMAGSSAWPPTEATLILASDTSLRDLTVGNSGASGSHTALLAQDGAARTLVADVTARALGGGVSNLAIVLSGGGTGVTLQQVTALAENGSSYNMGLVNADSAAAILQGGIFTGRGGEHSRGVFNWGSGTTLQAMDVAALGENGSDLNQGLRNHDGATATLYGGVFTGRGGNQTGGVSNNFSSTLTAENVTTLAENGTENYSLGNYYGAAMTVRGATVTARGGVNNYGLSNELDVTMEAEGVIALAENGSDANYGLWNVNNGQATVRGGSFTGRGGTSAYGIANIQVPTTLVAEGVTALAEDGADANHGLYNLDGAAATLRGGSLTARGGNNARGIYNAGTNTLLEADNVTALGENGSDANHGLHNLEGAAARLRGGSFTAYEGISAYGLYNANGNTMLVADNVTALGEGGNYDYGLCNLDAATATLHSGSFTGRGGIQDQGILNYGSGTMLEAESTSATAEYGSSVNYGLHNAGGAIAMLHGGSFASRGGIQDRGILNYGSGTMLEAESVNALAEDSSSEDYGLENASSAQARLRGGTFTGRGGAESRGIYNNNGSTLEAENVVALGENGSSHSMGLANSGPAVLRGGVFTGQAGSHTRGIYNISDGVTLDAGGITARGKDGSGTNHGLYNHASATAYVSQGVLEGTSNGVYQTSGTVHLAVSELDGGATRTGGTLSCYQVYDGSYADYTCP